jgi:hypothetical protein
VISTPADLAGLSHRIGYLRKGHDADVVIWDSHPLALGATPRQVFIDGIPQLSEKYNLVKPERYQVAPKTPDFTEEAKQALEYEGLPPLGPKETTKESVTFINVKSMWEKSPVSNKVELSMFMEDSSGGVVFVRGGNIGCFGTLTKCEYLLDHQSQVIDLKGGSITPGLISFGSNLGLVSIERESSTNDGYMIDPLFGNEPALLHDVETVQRTGLSLEHAMHCMSPVSYSEIYDVDNHFHVVLDIVLVSLLQLQPLLQQASLVVLVSLSQLLEPIPSRRGPSTKKSLPCM